MVVLARRFFTALAIGLFLPGCPLTDHYYIERGSGAGGTGAQSNGSAGFAATGGTFVGTGGADGVGGNPPNGDAGTGEADGTGAVTADAGASFGTGGDTSLGGDTSAGGTGGTMPVGNTGGTLPMNGGGGTTGGSGGAGGTLGGGNSGTGGKTGTGGTFGSSAGAGLGGKAARGGAANGGAANGGAGASGGISGGGQYQPLCDDSVVKGSACNRSSVQRCYRSCGPDGVGFKLETCMGPTYTEGACQFPASGDYSCYSVPAPYSLPAACPPGVPRAGDNCDVATCTPCFSGTTYNPQYQDSTGAQKTGYCVCDDTGVWTCATSAPEPSSWPCPGNPGCIN